MFIREIKKKLKNQSGEYEYIQHRLVESIRTKNGPRQRTILNLGTLNVPREKHKALANLIEVNLTGDSQGNMFEESPEIIGLAKHFSDVIIQKQLQSKPSEQGELPPLYEKIDVNTLTNSNGRTIGGEHIALTHLEQLGFFDILEECSFNKKEQQYAASQICARMVHPSSEREAARWLRETSGLDELLGVDFSHISDYTLHRVADKLFANKEQIEKKLAKNTQDLFSLDDKLILYDLTNSYFESPKRESNIAKYCKSKEKRNDCPCITLALTVDGYGFPKRSQIFKGNVGEPGTLWNILEKLDISSAENIPRTVVIDAGIATEENLKRLRDDDRFEYVAISRKKKFKEDIFKDKPSKELIVSHNKKLSVKTTRYEDETFLLCKSPERSAKEEAMFSQRQQRFEKGLTSLNQGLQKPRTIKGYASVCERIGRLKERYKVSKFFTIDIKQKDGKATEITWKYNANKRKEPGEYIIRTTRNDLEDSAVSLMHRTLTMIESAFRWLKSDLGLRPNHHQLDKRMMAHVTISVFAYFVLAPILNKLEWGGTFVGNSDIKEDHSPWDVPYGWQGVIEAMVSQTRVTTSFLCDDNLRMDVRTTLEPTAKQYAIYNRLKVNPRPLKNIIFKENKNVVPKNSHKNM